MTIKDVIADDKWYGRIRFVIGDEVHITNDKNFRYCATTIDVINKCKNFFDFVEKDKEEYKSINVFFDGEDKTVSIFDTTC